MYVVGWAMAAMQSSEDDLVEPFASSTLMWGTQGQNSDHKNWAGSNFTH